MMPFSPEIFCKL